MNIQNFYFLKNFIVSKLMLCFLLSVKYILSLKLTTFIFKIIVILFGRYIYLSYICIIQTERYFSKTN